MKHFLVLCFALILSLCSCNERSSKGVKVGVDTTWAPLQFLDRQDAVTAFSTELLVAIGKVETMPFIRITKNWDELLQGLQQGDYEAMLSSMPPYLFNQKLFDFSAIYLALGPVLVVRVTSTLDSIAHLKGKEIAVLTGSSNDLILQKTPGVLIRYYPSEPTVLNALVAGDIEGVLMDVLTASAYCNDLYRSELKIVTPPLTDEGLRLITLHEKSNEVVTKFNRGLEKVQKEGVYAKLLAKWGL